MVDLDDPAVIEYMSNDTPQREVVRSEKAAGINVNSTPLSEIKTEIHPINATTSDLRTENQPTNRNARSDIEALDAHQMNQYGKSIKIRKDALQVAILEKKYVPWTFIDDAVFRYIEKLHITLERSSSVFINEVGQKILEAGEIMPAHIEAFTNLVLEAIHTTKNSIAKNYKSYEPKL